MDFYLTEERENFIVKEWILPSFYFMLCCAYSSVCVHGWVLYIAQHAHMGLCIFMLHVSAWVSCIHGFVRVLGSMCVLVWIWIRVCVCMALCASGWRKKGDIFILWTFVQNKIFLFVYFQEKHSVILPYPAVVT